LGISQLRRQFALDFTVLANATGNANVNIPSDPCNVHGLIVDVRIGSIGIGLSFGTWALTLRPRASTSIPDLRTADINAEKDNPVFWMLGSWMADEQGAVDRVGGSPRTSRNCPRDSKLNFAVENSPISGATVRVHGVVTWFETIR